MSTILLIAIVLWILASMGVCIWQACTGALAPIDDDRDGWVL